MNGIVHTLTDVDIADLAQQQRPDGEEASSSLKLEEARFSRIDRPVLCDTSLGRLRVLVPESRQRQIFDAIHGLAHPSGKVTLAIISRAYAWRNMGARHPAMGKAVPGLQRKQGGDPREASGTTDSGADSEIRPCAYRHRGAIPSRPRLKHLLTMVDRTTRWPEAIPIADTTVDTVLHAFLGS